MDRLIVLSCLAALACGGKKVAPPDAAPPAADATAPAPADAAPPDAAAPADAAPDAAAAGDATDDAATADGSDALGDATDDVIAEPPLTPLGPVVAGELAPATDAHRPRFSPDGRRVTYQAGAEGKRDIYVVAIAGADGKAAPVALVTDAADDRDPSFTADGKRVVFASNRGGKYDVYIMDVPVEGAPGAQVALGAGGAEADALEPTISPLRYSFSAVLTDGCSPDGAAGEELATYEKLVYTRVSAKGSEVWFRSLDGKHEGRLSKAGEACWGARYSGDGLSLAMTCGDRADSKRVAHDTRAVWDMDYGTALKAINPTEGKEGEMCPGVEAPDAWKNDACLKKLPRRYARHAPAPIPDDTRSYEASGYSANQTLVLGTGPAGAATRLRTRKAGWIPLDDPGATAPISSYDWSPDGTSVAVERTLPDGTTRIARVPTSYYLQDVKDLVDYPELWEGGPSEHLAKNRFVVRAGDAKEMFTSYELTMYDRRAPFVTADAAIQLVRDEFSNLLKAAEEKIAQDELLPLLKGLMDAYAKRPQDGMNRFYTEHFAVAWALLEAASRMPEPTPSEPFYDEKPPEVVPLEKKLEAELAAVIDEVPQAVRASVKAAVAMALAHEGIIEVAMPGQQPIKVDFSQMKPRGHYTDGILFGYFVAMKWLMMVPLPLDASAVDLVMELEKAGLMGHWAAVDALVAAFMGRPIDVTVSHVTSYLEKKPELREGKFDAATDVPALRALLLRHGELGIRGTDKAFADATDKHTPTIPFMLFPLRLGLDSPIMKTLTHPDVDKRSFPQSLDIFAALGVDAAERLALAEEADAVYKDAYAAALAKLAAGAPPPGADIWAQDLYHQWLGVLRMLATPSKPPASALLTFTTTPAWEDRLVSSALAGYAQLKHDSVLYAFQEFAVECDSEILVVGYIERPIRPRPRGFVEPNPELFQALAGFAGKAYGVFSPDKEPTANEYAEEGDPPINGRRTAERLAKIARLQNAGRSPSAGDVEWLYTIGSTMEMIFNASQGEASESAKEGRAERGLALVTDVFTNVDTALHIGVGRVDRMYVAVPDRIGARMTQGGVFSFYEFTHPASDRLTDEQWNDKIVAKDLPPRPRWIASFYEKGPKEQ